MDRLLCLCLIEGVVVAEWPYVGAPASATFGVDSLMEAIDKVEQGLPSLIMSGESFIDMRPFTHHDNVKMVALTGQLRNGEGTFARIDDVETVDAFIARCKALCK